jgi:hypothetical protein
VEARGLPDEQEVCVGVSDAEDDLRAARRQPAARAGSGIGRVGRERGPAIQNLRIRSHSPRRSSRPQKVRRSWAVRRCRESRRRKAGGESCRNRTPGTQDRRRSAPRAPRSGSRRSCIRTRRSASPRQCRHVPGRTANGPQAVKAADPFRCEPCVRRARSANVVRARMSIVASRTSIHVGSSERATISGQGSGFRRVA